MEHISVNSSFSIYKENTKINTSVELPGSLVIKDPALSLLQLGLLLWLRYDA